MSHALQLTAVLAAFALFLLTGLPLLVLSASTLFVAWPLLPCSPSAVVGLFPGFRSPCRAWVGWRVCLP